MYVEQVTLKFCPFFILHPRDSTPKDPNNLLTLYIGVSMPNHLDNFYNPLTIYKAQAFICSDFHCVYMVQCCAFTSALVYDFSFQCLASIFFYYNVFLYSLVGMFFYDNLSLNKSNILLSIVTLVLSTTPPKLSLFLSSWSLLPPPLLPLSFSFLSPPSPPITFFQLLSLIFYP